MIAEILFAWAKKASGRQMEIQKRLASPTTSLGLQRTLRSERMYKLGEGYAQI